MDGLITTNGEAELIALEVVAFQFINGAFGRGAIFEHADERGARGGVFHHVCLLQGHARRDKTPKGPGHSGALKVMPTRKRGNVQMRCRMGSALWGSFPNKGSQANRLNKSPGIDL